MKQKESINFDFNKFLRSLKLRKQYITEIFIYGGLAAIFVLIH